MFWDFTYADVPPDAHFLGMLASDMQTIALLEGGEPLTLWKFARLSSSIRKRTRVGGMSPLDEFYLFRSYGYSYYISDEPRPDYIAPPPDGGVLYDEKSYASEIGMPYSLTIRPMWSRRPRCLILQRYPFTFRWRSLARALLSWLRAILCRSGLWDSHQPMRRRSHSTATTPISLTPLHIGYGSVLHHLLHYSSLLPRSIRASCCELLCPRKKPGIDLF